MTVIARRIAAVPRRSASDAWRAICDLLADRESESRTELDQIAGVAAMLIAEEYTRDAPMIVSGNGPQLRLYTLHGEEAIEADLEAETPIAFDPTGGDWTLSLPCGVDDLTEVTEALQATPRITVREMTSTVEAATTTRSVGSRRPIVDVEELRRS